MVATSVSDKAKASSLDATKQKSCCNADVQAYLISKYREALKSGDKSFAKSCLLSTRLFAVNDPHITNEIYLMAKSDGDVVEAAKCFSNIFQDLSKHENSVDTLSDESLIVANQMKEETRLLLGELKNQYLYLKSAHSVANANARQVPSVCQSPLLSPRLRMSSEDRSMSRDTVLKLNNHLNNTNESLFYQQLYENLSLEVKTNLLVHSIDSCDNPFERCRLMMLAITLSHETASSLGPRLIQTLMDLSEINTDKSTGEKFLSTLPLSRCLYARSMLVLDAIPLVFGVEKSFIPELDLDELLQRIFSYYSGSFLENIANEYDFEELHEGLKKSIAARILGKEMSLTQEDSVEEHILTAIDCLFNTFLETYSYDTTTFETLKEIRTWVAGKCETKSPTFDQIKELIAKLELAHDIPESILFDKSKDNSTSGSQVSSTPPPKARGRPKKSQASVIVSPDDGVKRHLQIKSREAQFVFYSILQHMFSHCSQYLRQTRSRILINFDNPLAADAEADTPKSQRSSRSKLKALKLKPRASASKRIKTEHQVSGSRKIDVEIVGHLKEVRECLDFLTSDSLTFSRLWQRFLVSNQCDGLRWYLRIIAESMILSNEFETAIEILDRVVHSNQDEPKIKSEQTDLELSTLTVTTGSLPSVEVIHLRALAQLISCYNLSKNRERTFDCMEELMAKIKQSGLLTNDENYSSGNIIDECRILFSRTTPNGFPVFRCPVVNPLCCQLSDDHLDPPGGSLKLTSDTIIGHTIVLSQVDWPKESYIYERCIALDKGNKPISTTPQCLSASTKFTYTDFFHYIFDPNILEDFIALLNSGYTLDIKGSKGNISTNDVASHPSASLKSSSSSTRAGKAITTRGVNKTFKEDLKVALIAQMKNSTNLIPLDLITEFIQTVLVPFLRANLN